MKLKQITVSRNYHISNDDVYMKETLTGLGDIGEHEDEQQALNDAREALNKNFKAAYPHVRDYLNFDEVIQVNKSYGVEKNIHVEAPLQKAKVNGIVDRIIANPGLLQTFNEPKKNYIEQTIDDINACTDLEGEKGLLSFQLLAKSNEKFLAAWESKFKQLHPN